MFRLLLLDVRKELLSAAAVSYYMDALNTYPDLSIVLNAPDQDLAVPSNWLRADLL